jgi:5-methyltetrahydrofolate--homocysteine methyltransferase
MIKTISQVMSERRLVLDGAMGTQIFAKKPTEDEYGGAEFEGCVELLNERRREWIQSIHDSYFQAGADAVETNTFGCNALVLGEFGLAHRAYDLNFEAVKLAKEIAQSYSDPKFVIGSVGPGTRLLTLLQIDYQTLYRSYFDQMRGLIAGGADAILIETSQDLGQIKLAVRAAQKAMQAAHVKVPIWVQVTIETTGTMLVGTDIQSALAALEMFDIDVIGMNCATGPEEMRPHAAYLSEASRFNLSCLPNAGLPINDNGQTVYPLGPALFAEKVGQMAKDFGLNVVGGCCGTTPEHIRELAAKVKGWEAPVRKVRYERSVTSLYNSVPMDLEPKPLYVGERTNANGSKKFRDLLANDDYDGLVGIARGQLKEGAHVLDVCVAYVSRDEAKDMEEFVKRLVTQVNIPLVIDSTETHVIERALQFSPGKNIVNSINLEDGEEKARAVLQLCKEYGASVVALTIDELGMAKTLDRKLEVAQRLYDLAVGEFKLDPGDLIFDPLTFTLGSGDEEFRASAISTLDAIEELKKRFPGVKTILGLSNVSFGLFPLARQMLNSMMLYHAVKRGLDMAILNASKILPIAKIPEGDRKYFEDVIFDRREPQYDPLKKILERYSDAKAIIAREGPDRADLPIEERLKIDIIDGEKQAIVKDALEALNKYKPLDIINNILLEGMKIVGERFGAGEMQLPFVLESAEAMKAAVQTLEPYLERVEGYTKGKMLLATVKGDVHDIGKNLVEIILSNNGFSIVNLGIKQPIESILEKFKSEGADAIGLSGLLVKSTAIMKDNLQYMAERGFCIPVILGGAALTRKFVEETCQAVYPGPVFYAEDAFEGLRLMEALSNANKAGLAIDAVALRKEVGKSKSVKDEVIAEPVGSQEIKVIRTGETKVKLDENGQSSWLRKLEPMPAVPFWGTRIIEEPLEKIFGFLDEFALIRSRWGFAQGNTTEEEFAEVLEKKAKPILLRWKEQILSQGMLKPKGIYGYFPVCSEGNELLVYHPETTPDVLPAKREIIARFAFPRQEAGRRLCLADYYRHVSSGELDILGVQIVTMGPEASVHTAKLYEEQNFSDYFYLHGLSTELTEAFAEMLHKRIRTELGIVDKDSKSLRQLFSQGYQGSRYSFGYPACPEMELNAPLLRLLGAQRIGVELSESFQMVPEQTTSAIVSWHPQARYFSV